MRHKHEASMKAARRFVVMYLLAFNLKYVQHQPDGLGKIQHLEWVTSHAKGWERVVVAVVGDASDAIDLFHGD
jgi:hypothetical protein